MVVDRPLRGDGSSGTAPGEPTGAKGWIRGWAARGGTSEDFLFVMLYPAESALEARLFVAGGLAQARRRGEHLPPVAEGVERVRLTEGGMEMELAAFARDRIGVQIVAIGPAAVSVLEDTVASQLRALPAAEPPRRPAGGGLLPGLAGLAIGATAGLPSTPPVGAASSTLGSSAPAWCSRWR